MDIEDLAAASQFQNVRDKLKQGPFFTGYLSQKGYVIQEPQREPTDHIKRYTDKYLQSRQIGNSVNTFPFVVEFFPEELHKALGLDTKSRSGSEKTKQQFADVESAVKAAENGGENGEGRDDDASNDENEEEVEDEFEELEDDDYNAEKYFDDGDEYGDGDDDGGEAAY